jgi:hypothetical protein
MKRNRFRIRIRIWLVLAVAVASLGLASSVQAMVMSDGDAASGATPQTTLVATTDSGFSWADAGIGAAIALAAAFGSIAVVRLAHNGSVRAT